MLSTYLPLKTYFIGFSLMLGIFLGGCDSHQEISELKPILNIDWSPEVVESDKSLMRFTDPKTNLMGYKDSKGKIIIPARFKMAQDFNKFGIADVWWGEHHDNWYKIDKSGKILVKSYFFDNAADYYVAGLSRFIENGKVGFIDQKANIVIPARYDWASGFWFNAPIAIVCQGCKSVPHTSDGKGCCHSEIKGGKWGTINREGEVVVPLEFDRYDSSYKDHTLAFFKGKERFQVFTTKDGSYRLVKSGL